MTATTKSPDGMRVIKADPKRFAVKPWIYYQENGEVFHYENGDLFAKGYSGKGEGLNQPRLEHMRGIGPIPTGLYMIGRPRNSERTGRFVLDLTPLGHKALGRSGFQIHGDNRSGDMSASQGCIVLGPKERSEIANGSPLLQVLGPPDPAPMPK